jgi:hypothetical protein
MDAFCKFFCMASSRRLGFWLMSLPSYGRNNNKAKILFIGCLFKGKIASPRKFTAAVCPKDAKSGEIVDEIESGEKAP